MTKTTVKQLAEKVNMTVDRLFYQFQEAGLNIKDAEQEITTQEAQVLLQHLSDKIGVAKKSTVTLKRKTVSRLKTGDGAQDRTVNIEVRKKRQYTSESVSLAEEKAKEIEKAAVLAEQKRLAEEAEQRLKEEREQAKVAKARAKAAAQEVRIQDKSEKRQIEQQKAHEKEKIAAKQSKTLSKKKSDLQKTAPTKKKIKVAEPAEDIATSITEHKFQTPTAPIVHEIAIPEKIIVSELAQKMSVKAAEVIKVMFKMGAMATINQVLDQDTAVLVVEEMGHVAKPTKENEIEESLDEAEQPSLQALPRPPVVTIMGHVDHGKTSLLDYIRRTKIAAGEVGGITQHIGAYHVRTDKGSLTFLDTPGHEAFTAMRARGAQCTDIVVLIIAADDGIKPQTLEAIQHAKAANVPIIVAINKIDKPEADPDKVTSELGQHDIIPEEWGGDTMFINVSAKSGEGIDELLDSILLQAEVLELTAVQEGIARGIVIESKLDKWRGPVATVIVQSGNLTKGDIVLAGMEYGRVRALQNELGKRVDSAGPSIPIEIVGLSGIPNVGDKTIVVKDERKAREIALFRQGKYRDVKIARQQATKLDNLFAQMSENQQSNLNIVLKASVLGSVEVLKEALNNLSTDKVKVTIVASGTGGITKSDVNLAIGSNAVVIGFNVRPDAAALKLIQKEEVEFRYYTIIYNLLDEIKAAMTGMLKPEFKEEVIGIAKVRDVFKVSKFGTIAGCIVIEGVVKHNKPIRVLRDNVVIFQGELESLRRFKDNVAEVRDNTECGIGVKNYSDMKVGDQIEVYERIRVASKL